ncbi:hypothetical protein ABFS83_14G173300 [Erythranthe nasuta]
MKAHDSKFQEESRQVKKKKKKKKKMPTMCVNRVWYDRDNSTINCDAQRLQRLVNFAELAIDFFNKTSPVVKYNLVELVYATAKLVSDYLFHLTFTAKRDDDKDAKTFDAWIYEAIKKPARVKSVEIVAT